MDFTDSETQPPEEFPDLENDYNMPPPLATECKSFKWNIQVIDSDGTIEGKMMTSNDVWKMQNSRVIVQFDGNCGQPIGDSAGLLGSWLGQLSNDIRLLLIDYSDWRLVNIHTKRKAWDVIRAKFWFDDPDLRKGYVMSALGNRCKDVKLRFWRDYKRDGLNETLQNRPEKVPEDQWENLFHIRFNEKWKRMQERNTRIQKKHLMPHVCGRKSFARKRNEIKTKTGKTPSRAEFFIETRTKSNGSFVCEDAKTRAEALTTLLSQNTQRTTIDVAASFDDEFAQVFGPDPPGRIRCVGRGPTPSKLVRCSNATRTEIENSDLKAQVKTLSDQVIGLATKEIENSDLKAQVNTLSDQVTGLTTFVKQIIGNSNGEQARAWATSFAAAFVNIPNPAFSNIPIQRNPNQEMNNGSN